MKKFCLFLCSIFIITMFSASNIPYTYAAANPNVKIGLYFASTAKSQIDISSNKGGVAFTAFDSVGNKEYEVYNSNQQEVITVRKDGFFTISGTNYTEVKEGASNVNSGPYHIQIEKKYSTYKDALSVALDYTKKGVASYPVYTDSDWEVWTGFYASKADGEKAIAQIKTKLGVSSLTVIDKSNTRIYGVNSTGEVKFMFASAKCLLRGKSLSNENPNPINIGSSKQNSFRGQVEFLRKTDSDMTIINVLPMEEYIYGVVPNEIQASSNIEAIKAQAIAARTFAYKTINKHAAYGFNLCTTTDCHVYKGYSSENPNSNKAVDDTKDMVVTYNGGLAETLYFSSSGGRTESAVNVWGNDFPYLRSVEDKYESGNSYHYNWTVSYTVEEISQKLKNYGVGTVTSIEITKTSDAGRATEVVIKGTSKPEGVVIKNDRCRTFLGLDSQWYTINGAGGNTANDKFYIKNKGVTKQFNEITVKNASGQTKILSSGKVTVIGANGTKDTASTSTQTTNAKGFTFVGKGWGHAVGMSQEGAKGYADAGYTYDQILAHYYTGTKIELKK